METKGAPESMATVNMKPEYAPSEYSEAPPAYHKPHSSAVQVAKIVAVTVVLVSFVLGSFMLAASYVQANASCRQLENDLELLSEVADRFDGAPQAPLQPEALIGEDTSKHQKRQTGKDTKDVKDVDNNSVESSDSSATSEQSTHEVPIHAHFPLTLDFDELAGNLVARNQKSKMNCIVEKKRAEELVDHKPKNIRLPFGVNLTTDPRLEKITGERMVIICESGNMMSSEPPKEPQQENDDNDDDDESGEDAIMIQPVMIPIPQAMFQTHMPQQVQPMSQPQQFVQPMRPFNPMEHMRPPMPPMHQFRPPMPPMRPPMEAGRPPMESYRPSPVREFVDSYRPIHPQEQMRPPMEQQRPQFIAIRQIEMRPAPVESESQSVESEEPQRPGLMTVAFRPPMAQQERQEEPERPMFIPQQVSIRVQAQEPNEMPPNPIIQHIIQQIITQKIMEARKAQEANRLQEESREDGYQPQPPQEPQREIPATMVHPGLPIPEILTELNRLPNPENRVIVAVATSEDESSEENSSAPDSISSNSSSDDSSSSSAQDSQDSSSQQDSQQDNQQESQPENQGPVMQLIQEPRESSAEMNGRQIYARRLPVSIPVNMHDQEQEPQAVASEEMRPHYVQPRSV